MKILGKGIIGLGCIAIGLLAYKYNPFQKEVIDLKKFNDYYVSDSVSKEESEVENGGLEVLTSNFYVISKDYGTELKESKEEQGEEDKKEEKIEIPQKEVYIVKSGDTLYDIAKLYNMDLGILKVNNPGIKSNIQIGDKINIVKGNGIFYKVKKGDSLYKIASKYRIDIDDLKKYNEEYINNLQPGQELFIKNPSLNVVNRIVKQSGGSSSKRRTTSKTVGRMFAMPVKWAGVSSPFGNRFHPVLKRYILHTGVDLRARYVPLHAARDGRVTYTGYMSGYGKIIIIDHGNGYQTRSAHLNNIYVKQGAYVKAGQVIGKTGMTGRVTGPHLHFEIRKNNRPYDPMKYLRR